VKSTTFFLAFAAILLIIQPVKAQKLSRFYSSRFQEGGSLYFINPNKDFKNREASVSVAFDVTFLSSEDSVTFNFSVFGRQPQEVDSVFLSTSKGSFGAYAARFFLDFAGKNWETRSSAKFSLSDFSTFINEQNPTILLKNHPTNIILLRSSERKWRKYSAALQKILFIIESDR